MKNPNGYGSITKLKRKNLRKPYNVRITVDIKNGKQVRKSIGYFATKQEALHALETYQENKYNVDYLSKTFEELWKEWTQNKLNDEGLSESTKRGYIYAEKCITDDIKKKKFVELKFKDYQDMFNELKKTMQYDSLRKVRSSISQLFDYAINNEIITTNYIKNINIGHSRRKGEVLIFTDEQIKHLWTIIESGYGNKEAQLTAKIMIMLIYNGCRISEFLNLKIEDVFIGDGYFQIQNAKTEAGIRKVPIHRKMTQIYEEFYDSKNEYLLTNENNGKKFSYANFRDSYWDRFVEENNWNKELTPHNARKTFSSLLKRFDADMTYQKLILGHEGALSLTEKVYTKVDVEKLIETVNLIPDPYDL